MYSLACPPLDDWMYLAKLSPTHNSIQLALQKLDSTPIHLAKLSSSHNSIQLALCKLDEEQSNQVRQDIEFPLV